MAIKIRSSKLNDYKRVKTLLVPSGLAGRWFTKNLFSRLLRKNKRLYFVAEEKDLVVGTVFSSHDGGYYGYIYKLAVAFPYRRRGVAVKLVRTVLREMKKARIDFVFLHVAKINYPSQKFFRSLGFRHRATHLLMDNYRQ